MAVSKHSPGCPCCGGGGTGSVVCGACSIPKTSISLEVGRWGGYDLWPDPGCQFCPMTTISTTLEYSNGAALPQDMLDHGAPSDLTEYWLTPIVEFTFLDPLYPFGPGQGITPDHCWPWYFRGRFMLQCGSADTPTFGYWGDEQDASWTTEEPFPHPPDWDGGFVTDSTGIVGSSDYSITCDPFSITGTVDPAVCGTAGSWFIQTGSPTLMAQGLPPLTTQVKSFVKAVATNGLSRLDDEVTKSRLEVCQTCELFRKQDGRCGACGCFVKWKAKLPKEQCPLGKWATPS